MSKVIIALLIFLLSVLFILLFLIIIFAIALLVFSRKAKKKELLPEKQGIV